MRRRRRRHPHLIPLGIHPRRRQRPSPRQRDIHIRRHHPPLLPPRRRIPLPVPPPSRLPIKGIQTRLAPHQPRRRPGPGRRTAIPLPLNDNPLPLHLRRGRPRRRRRHPPPHPPRRLVLLLPVIDHPPLPTPHQHLILLPLLPLLAIVDHAPALAAPRAGAVALSVPRWRPAARGVELAGVVIVGEVAALCEALALEAVAVAVWGCGGAVGHFGGVVCLFGLLGLLRNGVWLAVREVMEESMYSAGGLVGFVRLLSMCAFVGWLGWAGEARLKHGGWMLAGSGFCAFPVFEGISMYLFIGEGTGSPSRATGVEVCERGYGLECGRMEIRGTCRKGRGGGCVCLGEVPSSGCWSDDDTHGVRGAGVGQDARVCRRGEGARPILDPWPGTRLVRLPLVVSRQRGAGTRSLEVGSVGCWLAGRRSRCKQKLPLQSPGSAGTGRG